MLNSMLKGATNVFNSVVAGLHWIALEVYIL